MKPKFKMNSRSLLVSFIALFAIISVFTVNAAELADNVKINFNGIRLDADDTSVISSFTGERIPLEVFFRAGMDADNVRVKARISGLRDDVDAETSRFRIFNNTFYTKLLTLNLPRDLDDSTEDRFTLVVTIESRDGVTQKEFNLQIQRESFDLATLFVDVAPSVTAGEHLEVDVVAKNLGAEKLNDVVAVLRVPELDIEKIVYMDDLFALDSGHDEEFDSAERVVLLRVPENAAAGKYTLEIVLQNPDATSEVILKQFVVESTAVGADVLVPASTKTARIGEEITFDIVLLNRGEKAAVYEIIPESTGNIFVSSVEPIVVVGGDSSKTVKVRAIAQDAGNYPITVNVNSEGQLLEKVTLNVQVQKGASPISARGDGIVVLTIVLAIIFVVLLVILLVLLTRKPKKESEESYY